MLCVCLLNYLRVIVVVFALLFCMWLFVVGLLGCFVVFFVLLIFVCFFLFFFVGEGGGYALVCFMYVCVCCVC